ncbi:hypothetical protein SLA2020_217080 [Shorea laevis]
MQAAFTLSTPAISIAPPSKTMALPRKSTPRIQFPPCRARRTAAAANDNSTVDYSSMTSVFPAEACETIGGEACDVEMYPEVKPKSESESTKTRTTSELYDREYVEYNSPKTVFLDEACDDLGGEFCEPEYKA